MCIVVSGSSPQTIEVILTAAAGRMRPAKARSACLSLVPARTMLQSKRLDLCSDLHLVYRQLSHAADTDRRHTKAMQVRCCRRRHAHS